jgi:hypothetical protein
MPFILFLLKWKCSYDEIMTTSFWKSPSMLQLTTKTGFDPSPVHVEIRMDKLASEQIFHRILAPSAESSKFSAVIHASSPKVHFSNWQCSQITNLKKKVLDFASFSFLQLKIFCLNPASKYPSVIYRLTEVCCIFVKMIWVNVCIKLELQEDTKHVLVNTNFKK